MLDELRLGASTELNDPYVKQKCIITSWCTMLVGNKPTRAGKGKTNRFIATINLN